MPLEALEEPHAGLVACPRPRACCTVPAQWLLTDLGYRALCHLHHLRRRLVQLEEVALGHSGRGWVRARPVHVHRVHLDMLVELGGLRKYATPHSPSVETVGLRPDLGEWMCPGQGALVITR